MTESDAAEAAKLSYGALNIPVFEAIPIGARRVLDVGCGTGTLGQALKNRQAVEVTGLTYSEPEAVAARKRLDRVEVCDLNAFGMCDLGNFDCIVCSHVLEHLYWPGEFLKRLSPLLSPEGRLVVALPNVLAWRQRLAFLCGRFRYADGGLMDRTHFRFFDRQTARELVSQAGYDVLSAEAQGVFPLARYLPGIGKSIDRAAVKIAPGLFGIQFIITAKPRA
ncbi:MAG: class I SAM-dependent methyltransferase [Planctomycetia bacterium]|nr:class I SAM-dependent methyltransferase [Planctomycetia bacterium]